MSPTRSKVAALAAALAPLALAACGGGGTDGGGAGTQMGKVTVAITDAPSADFERVWITIRQIDFHKLDDAHPLDPQWLSYPLAQPVTIDLAQLANGNLAEVFRDLLLPVGVYRQIRLVLAGEDEPLTPSAQAAGLAYNNQVDCTGPAAAARVAPLAVPSWRRGVTVFGTFTVEQNKTLRLALDFDSGSDVVIFPDPLSAADGLSFTLKPFIRYFDLDASGAIVGRVDPATLAPAALPAGRGYLALVKAQQLNGDGTLHVVARATHVRADGSFALYPLPAPGTNTKYDILINGYRIATTIVRNVPVTRGSTPGSNPTQLSAAPLALAPADEYLAALSSPAQPTGSWINFYQTVPGVAAPYQVRFRHVNPFTGLTGLPVVLPAGNLRVGEYVANGAPALSEVVPVEGGGSFSAIADATFFTRGAPTVVAPPASGGMTYFAGASLAVNPAVAVPGTIRVNVTAGTPARFDRGQLVITRFGLIVDSVDISGLLAAGGTAVVDDIPAGSAAKPLPAGVYFAFARVWNSGNPLLRPRIVPILEAADLRTSANATLALALP